MRTHNNKNQLLVFFPSCTDKIRCMILNAVCKRPIRIVNKALKLVCKGSSMPDNSPTLKRLECVAWSGKSFIYLSMCVCVCMCWTSLNNYTINKLPHNKCAWLHLCHFLFVTVTPLEKLISLWILPELRWHFSCGVHGAFHQERWVTSGCHSAASEWVYIKA